MKAWIVDNQIFVSYDPNYEIPPEYTVFEFQDTINIDRLKIENNTIVLKTEEEYNQHLFESKKQYYLEYLKNISKKIEKKYLHKYSNAEIQAWPYKIKEIENNTYSNPNSIIYKELVSYLKRNPTDQELQQYVNMILSKYQEYINISIIITSFRRKFEGAQTLEQLDMIYSDLTDHINAIDPTILLHD